MLFWQFSNITIYVWVFRKMPDQHFRNKVRKRWNTTGPICHLCLTRIRTLPLGLENRDTIKCWLGIFPTTLTYMENSRDKIWLHSSPIQKTSFYFLLKFYEARISECNIIFSYAQKPHFDNVGRHLTGEHP